MEKKRRLMYTMLTRWGLSYVVIATLAIFVITFCSFQYTKALRNELEYTNSVQLEMTQLQMDRNVRFLRTFCNKASMNKTVKELRKQTSWKETSRYELYRLVEEIANEIMIDGGTDNCYLYFPHTDLLVSNKYYNSSRNFYDIAMGSVGISFEQWQEIISQDYRTSQVFSIDTAGGKPLTVLVKPLDSSNRQRPAVNAIMVMDLGKILKTSSWFNKDRDMICLIDRTNKRLVSTSPLCEDVKGKMLEDTARDKEKLVQKVSDGTSVISYISSQYENWDYAVITQEQESVKIIRDLQKLAMGMSLLYLFISIIAITYAALKQYRPMQKIVSELKKQDTGEEGQEHNDEFAYISQSIQNLVNKNREISTVARQQQNAISREIFHRLLTEPDAVSAINTKILERMGICQEEKIEEGLILSYRLTGGSGFLLEDIPSETREMYWFILQNVTEENLEACGCSSVCFREGSNRQVFFCQRSQEGIDLKVAVRQVAEASEAFIRAHFSLSYRTAMSDIHCGPQNIYQAYQEVRRVFEYQKTEGGREAISFGDINLLPVDTLLKYPMDAENRLVQNVSNGDAQAAWLEIQKLLEDNQVNCLAPEAMQFLVSNIAVSIIRAVGRISKETALPVSQQAVMEACRQGEAQKMREELERLVETACREVTEFHKREKENMKGQLYQNARAYVEENYSDASLSVNSMAEHFKVQATYLSKLFREMEGDKLSQYIHQVRLNHVKELLMKNVKLEDIAQQCGFGSQRTFLRIFKQYEGITPTQYKELRENEGKEDLDL